jgi:hypothetical protein
MRKKNKMNEASIDKAWHKFFRIKWQQSWNAYQIKNRRRVCETLTKDISSKRLTLHRNIVEVWECFRYAHANKTHRSRRLFVFSTRINSVFVELYLWLITSNAQARVAFLRQRSSEQTTHVSRRRNDKFTQAFEHRKEIKDIS